MPSAVAVPSLHQSSSTASVWPTVWMILLMHSVGPGGKHRGGSCPQEHSFAQSQIRTMTAQCHSDSAHVQALAEAVEVEMCAPHLGADVLVGLGLMATEEEKSRSLCVI